MKKIIISLLLALASLSVFAIPARPGWFKRTQPDGTVIEIRLVGDEFGHAYVDRSGQVLERGKDGFLRPVDSGTVSSRRKAAMAKRSAANMRRVRGKAPKTISGSPKIPVILIEFKDVKFKSSFTYTETYEYMGRVETYNVTYDGNVYSDTPESAFGNILSQPGYLSKGSVLDFYKDNSNGVYTPEFVVLPKVTLDNNMAYYGENVGQDDKAPELALYDAVKKLSSTQNFSQFDNDGDGYIDMILMYYAGMNEAEGGPEDSIWPHQWNVQESEQKDGTKEIRNQTFNGKKLGKYFCTSELSYESYKEVGDDYVLTVQLCGIGTTCHEFAHSLGLPDFYDVDYEDNGYAGGTYAYDTMCEGSYNDNGNTPPFFGAEELMMLGWMGEPTDLPMSGSVTIPALSRTLRVAYKAPSGTDGEYFLLECRGSSGWDAYTPGPGLIVYHVDKSSRVVYSDKDDEYTAFKLWDEWEATNSINAIGKHPCYYIIPAACQNYNYDEAVVDGYTGNPTETTGLHYKGSDFAFGVNGHTSYSPVDWNQDIMDYKLKDISYAGGSVSFNVAMNLCYIVKPASITAGSSLPLKLEGAPSGSTVKWFLDDVEVSGSSVTLAAGKHLVEARVTSVKNTSRIELELDVE